jgi:TolB protein
MYFNIVGGKPVFGSRKIPAEGGAPAEFTDYIVEHPRWSPDGRFIVFDADSGAAIRMIGAEGGPPKDILPDSVRIHNGGLPIWSPAGTQIAFKDTSSLCILDVATGAVTRIFRQEGAVPIPGCWTPDGKSVLVALMDRTSRMSTVWRVSADGKDRRQVTGHLDSLYRYLALSPDGSLLVYAALQGKRLGLWVMPSEGGKSLPLTITEGSHNESPVWSPDGRRIAYASGRTGHGDIYIMDLDVPKIRAELKIPDR